MQANLHKLVLTAVHLIGNDLADKMVFMPLEGNQIDEYVQAILDGILNESERILDENISTSMDQKSARELQS